MNWIKKLLGLGPKQLTPLELKAARLLDKAMQEEAARAAEAAQLLTVRDNFISAQQNETTPWAMFEIIGFDEQKGDQIKVEFNWNEAFIKHLEKLGFVAETPEDSVQLFFYTAQMRPTEIEGDQTIPPDDLPALGAFNQVVK